MVTNLYKPSQKNITDKAVSYFLSKLQDTEFRQDICRIYLYGSRARDTADFDSDIDILLIFKDRLSDAQRKQFRALISDLLQDDLPEFDIHTAVLSNFIQENTCYYENIKSEGVVIYEA